MTIRKRSSESNSQRRRKTPYRKPGIDSFDTKTVVRALGTAQAIGGSGGGVLDEIHPHPGKRGKKGRGRG